VQAALQLSFSWDCRCTSPRQERNSAWAPGPALCYERPRPGLGSCLCTSQREIFYLADKRGKRGVGPSRGLLCFPPLLEHVRVVRKPVAKLLDLLQRVWKSEIRKPNSVVRNLLVHGVYSVIPLNLDRLRRRRHRREPGAIPRGSRSGSASAVMARCRPFTRRR
jgi:hypothetical protein